MSTGSPVFPESWSRLSITNWNGITVVINITNWPTTWCPPHRDWTALHGFYALDDERAVEAEVVAESRNGPWQRWHQMEAAPCLRSPVSAEDFQLAWECAQMAPSVSAWVTSEIFRFQHYFAILLKMSPPRVRLLIPHNVYLLCVHFVICWICPINRVFLVNLGRCSFGTCRSWFMVFRTSKIIYI